MHTSNPYAQGWFHGLGSGSSQSPVSILGALPTYPMSNPFLSFRYTNLSPTVLNCVVLGPTNQPYIQVTTSDTSPARTTIKNLEGRSLATIDWFDHPTVDIPGVVPRQATGQWLRVSPDRNSRSMVVRGVRCTWTVSDNAICLYSTVPGAPELIAKIVNWKNSITLEIGSAVVQLGLLEATIVATVLMQSRRSID